MLEFLILLFKKIMWSSKLLSPGFIQFKDIELNPVQGSKSFSGISKCTYK